MDQHKWISISRRDFLRASLVASAPLAVALGSGKLQPARPLTGPAPIAPAQAQELSPTPECPDADDVTPAQTEGPYFTPNSPERSSLIEAGMIGTRIVISGLVLTRSCQPV